MLRRLLLPALALSVLSLMGTGSAAAAGKPYVQFKPSGIYPKHAARVVGGGLKPSTYYFLAITVPNFAHHSDERLFGPVKTDKNGNLNAPVAIPPIIACGKASVRAYPTGSKSYISTTVTVLGCPKPTHAPPPAPHKKHK
jgi:hypothetical protein